MYNVPDSATLNPPSRGYWAACVALLATHAVIGWFILLIYDGWASALAEDDLAWIVFAGMWFMAGMLLVPGICVTRRPLLPWIFALQIGVVAAMWARQGWMLQMYWDQRLAGPSRWYYLSGMFWLAMLLHLWVRARRSVAGDP